jgi:hypothetical protein
LESKGCPGNRNLNDTQRFGMIVANTPKLLLKMLAFR